jgi:hypothetical protein
MSDDDAMKAAYDALGETRIPHWRIAQKVLIKRFAVDMEVAAQFFDAGGCSAPPQQFVFVVDKIVRWFECLAYYHLHPTMRQHAKEVRDQLKAALDVWARTRDERDASAIADMFAAVGHGLLLGKPVSLLQRAPRRPR